MRNAYLVPSKQANPTIFAGSIVAYVLTIVVFVMLYLDYSSRKTSEGQEEYSPLDLFLSVIFIGNTMIRAIIIAVRYGSLSPLDFHLLCT